MCSEDKWIVELAKWLPASVLASFSPAAAIMREPAIVGDRRRISDSR
jgi:hypothetical protein